VRTSRWNLAALVVALVAVGLATAFFVASMSARDEAHAELRSAQAAVAKERSHSRQAGTQLARARAAVQALSQQLAAVPTSADAVAALDTQSAAAIKAAVDAGLAGNIGDYNSAVGQLNALNPQHDAALEQLRVQVNALVTALEAIRS
jgi:hypothetical protein